METEASILNYFFTNAEKPIFVAKNLHPGVWALLQGRYSRSTVGMRENFISLLNEDPENFEQLKSAIIHQEKSVRMDKAIEKAMSFMEKWVVGFGHSSIAEGAVLGVGIEGLSILATKVIEDCRLGSFMEKSTRYLLFSKDSFYLDPKLEHMFGKEVRPLITHLFDTYMQLQNPVLEEIKSQNPNNGMDEKEWEKKCAAQRFDSVRYLLPTCTKTSMGWTVNARELSYGISKFLSHPLFELQEIGLNIKEESQKVLPSLIRHADKNGFISETPALIKNISNKYVNECGYNEQPNVKLVAYPENLEEQLAASILFSSTHSAYPEIHSKVKSLSNEDKKSIFDACFSKIGDFDRPIREFEHSYLTFEVVMDYGAFRDLQRNRMNTQTNQLLDTSLGYDVAPFIDSAGVKSEYDDAMKHAKEVYDIISPTLPYEAQYVLPLAYRKRFLLTLNVRELFYLIRLRSRPQGHISYRRISKMLYDAFREKFPILGEYIVCYM